MAPTGLRIRIPRPAVDIPSTSNAPDVGVNLQGVNGGVTPSASGEPQAIEHGTEDQNDNLGAGRRVKRRAVALSLLRECTCGIVVEPNTPGSIRCTVAGCETEWVRSLRFD